MIFYPFLLAVHLLGVVLWVGGMGFALMVLRPSLAVLEPAQRMALHMQVFKRFFRIVWHAMPLVLLSGYAMVFAVFGGFAGVNGSVHLMHLIGLIMAAIFVAIVMLPWKALQRGDATALDSIRKLITVNLALGLLVVVVAAFSV